MKETGILWAALLVGCAAPLQESAPEEEDTAEVELPLSSFSCKAKSEKGYDDGKPFDINVVTIDGELVERNTANAYYFMAKAAAADGVELGIVSGFRTMAEQQYLYNCYINCSCNNCNLAAKPGYSNHQSGSALDLNTSAAGVYGWLGKHAGGFGFVRTVPSEIWHWEYQGSLPVGGPCGTLSAALSKAWSDADKDTAGKADYEVCAGESFRIWLRMLNDGTARWADLASGGKHVGERVRLFSVGGKDALTGIEELSVKKNLNTNVLPKVWGGGAGKDCDDDEGCRRTVFTEAGLAGKAPEAPGVYTTSWRLRDESPVWSAAKAFGPKVSLSFRVKSCAQDAGEPPDATATTGDGVDPPPDTPPPNEPPAGAGEADAEVGCSLPAAPARAPFVPLASLLALALALARRRRS